MPLVRQELINWAAETIGVLLKEWKALKKENESLKREIQQYKEHEMEKVMRAKMQVQAVTPAYGETEILKAFPV